MVENKTHFIFNYGPAIAGLGTMLVAVGYEALGDSEPASLISLIIVGLVFISGDLLLHNYLRAKQRESVSDIKQTLGRIERNQESKMRLIKAPSSIDEYKTLWGGFETGEYYAFNPAFRIELRSYLSRDKEVVKGVFEQRYKSPAFKGAQYLFLVNDADGKKDYEEFCKIMREVKNKCDRRLSGKLVSKNEVVEKLEVKITSDKRARDYTEFYVGKQLGIKTCIIEPAPSDNVLSEGRGLPKYYFITNDEHIWEEYKNEFAREWGRKEAKEVKDLTDIVQEECDKNK